MNTDVLPGICPGFGGSDGPDAGIDMWQLVDLLADFAKARLGQGPAHFVRLSAGGMILQHFAAAHPEMARSITILDSSPKFDFGGNIKPADFANPILAELEGSISPAAFSDGMIVNHNALELLDQIKFPTLVMAGEKDAETPPAYAYAIARHIKGASATVIPNADHIANLENSKTSISAISSGKFRSVRLTDPLMQSVWNPLAKADVRKYWTFELGSLGVAGRDEFVQSPKPLHSDINPNLDRGTITCLRIGTGVGGRCIGLHQSRRILVSDAGAGRRTCRSRHR